MKRLEKLLRIEDGEDVFEKFELAAHDLIDNWLVINGDFKYEIMEVEFFLYSKKLDHTDPYVSCSKVQQTFGHWLLNGGVELSIGEENRYGSVQIRTLRCQETGKMFNGPQRVFRELFEDAGDALAPSGLPYLERKPEPRGCKVIAAPRVGLNFTEFSEDMELRIDYLLRPYRFICEEVTDMADKYIALLFLEKSADTPGVVPQDHTIFKKYLHAFDIGYNSGDINKVWEERSKSLRLARLMGYKMKAGGLQKPRLSNRDINAVQLED